MMVHTDPSTEPELHTELTEERYRELVEQVEGQRVVSLALWETSLADPEDVRVPADERAVFDMDLYLENRRCLELYGVHVHRHPSELPLRGLDQLGTIVADLVTQGIWLDEIASTEDGGLVLILARHREPRLYLDVGGWSLGEWDRLPGGS